MLESTRDFISGLIGDAPGIEMFELMVESRYKWIFFFAEKPELV